VITTAGEQLVLVCSALAEASYCLKQAYASIEGIAIIDTRCDDTEVAADWHELIIQPD